MSEPDASAETPEVEPPATPKRKRRGLRALVWVCVVLMLLMAGLAGAGYYAIGRSFVAPDWVKTRAEQEFSKAIPDAIVTFSDLTISIQKDWHPRILLERVQIAPVNGDAPLEFSEVETSLSYRRLLERQVAARDFRVSGVFLQARREAAGQVGVAVGETADEQRTSTDIDQLVAQIDTWLTLPQFERLTSVDIDAVTIQFDDLRANRSWIVDGGVMTMRRKGDDLQLSSNFALLGGRDYVSTLEFDYQSTIGSLAAGFSVKVDDVVSKDIASQSPALTWLEILDAPISGELHVLIDDEGQLGPLNAGLEIKKGVLQPRDGIKPIPFETARTAFTFVPDTNTLVFDELALDSAWGTAKAAGNAHLLAPDGGLPTALLGQFSFSEVAGNPADLFDDPIALDKVQGDFRLTFEPFKVEIGELLVQDQGQNLVLSGRLETTEEDWVVSLDGHMDALDARRVVEWWPERAAAKTRTWIDENIHAGRLTDINVAIRSQPKQRPDVYVDFDFEDADVRYAKTLPIIQDGKGEAVLMRDRFVVKAHDGFVAPPEGGTLGVAGTTFTIPDTREKPTRAEVGLNTSGTVTAVASLLDQKPLNVFTNAKLPVEFAEGQAQVKGTLTLPLVKGLKVEQVAFSASALVRDVTTDHFIPGKPITSDLLIVQADNETVSVAGTGRVAGVPFDAKWQGDITAGGQGKSQLTGTLEIGDRFAKAFELGLPDGMIRGASSASMSIDFEKGQVPSFMASSDLIGTRLTLADLGWSKAPGQKAALGISGRFTAPISLDRISLSGPGLSADGTISVNETGGLGQANWQRVRVADWFDGAVTLVGRGAGRAPSVQINGGTLHLPKMQNAAQRGAGSGGSGGAGGSSDNGPLQARLDRVVISDGIELTDLSGTFSSAGGFNGKFTSGVNGSTSVNGVIVPQGARSAVRIRSADGGGVIRAAGIMRQTYGGDLDLTLRPVGAEGHYDGKLVMKNVRVREAPAIAALLNAISVVGLLEQLGGEGIAFADVQADFKLSPGGVNVTEGSAVGPSMGLSMDGIYRFDNKQLQMQGVISPLYLLNVVGRPISRRGEGLFGFNYQLGGTSDDPAVRVNPLSVLTPGFLRDIFRRPTSSVPDVAPDTTN